MGATGLMIKKLEAEHYDVLDGVADGFKPNPDTSITLIAVENGQIIGRIFLLAPTHIEGPWIRGDHRNRMLGKQLIERAEQEARNCGITKLFAYGADRKIEDYLERLGFEPAPMTVWSKEL